MSAEWPHTTVIYQIDPSLFSDRNDDGCGDLAGIVERLDYLRSLGVGALWLLPIFGSPFRDGGYDVDDHRIVAPRFGREDDFRLLIDEANKRGMRVILELVLQHTSEQHPWFEQARQDRTSRYRDYFIWADEPIDDGNQPIFPGVEDSIWQWDEQAGQFYRHLFYRHEPDLNLANPAVVEEIEQIIAHWLHLGVAGFRLDAASHAVEQAGGGNEEHGVWLLERLAAHARSINPDCLLMGEVDVEPARFRHYFGTGNRLQLALDFWLNNHVFLALARARAEPLWRALQHRPAAPDGTGYALWLRNHDELDLERLTEQEREEVMQVFAPQPHMRAYGRGIRRRLAPMLDGDVRHQALAHALLASLPGTPIIRYGEEIGMGDDLLRPERLAVRTPMQWNAERNGGFSRGTPKNFPAPLIDQGPFGYPMLNVAMQQEKPESLLSRCQAIFQMRAVLTEVGSGTAHSLPCEHPAVFAIRHEGEATTIMLANLGRHPAALEQTMIQALQGFEEILADGTYPSPASANTALTLNGFGYRWFRRGGSKQQQHRRAHQRQ
ncbi:alpha-amylase family protein [Pseudomonas hamedanensis]|uniref:Alpha-amylase family protein n=1 Tax=Pseudomonas hamedanensis TaxID=2745504 RepID=A0A9E6THL9_9PSED|nr:alpha-amylase family protein [Pseudomonas hamedanensis]QXI18412.1 alpha-amylase family protein [Pseudomonas hamedanensis]